MYRHDEDYMYRHDEDYMYRHDEDYMECPVCDGRNSNCNSCGGRGVFNRNEANNEVDEPFMKGVDYSDNSQYSLRKRIMNSMLESIKKPGTKEPGTKEPGTKEQKPGTRERDPFQRPGKADPNVKPAKAEDDEEYEMKNPGTKEQKPGTRPDTPVKPGRPDTGKPRPSRERDPFQRPGKADPNVKPAKAKYKKK